MFFAWRLLLTGWLMMLATTVASAQQRHGDALDDVMRVVPTAAVVGLHVVGAESRYTWQQSLAGMCLSLGATSAVTLGVKHSVNEWRPDRSDRNSMPSGHSAIAFAGATALHKEYGHLSPWVSIAGYSVAAAVAIDRVARDRHHVGDVAVGAAVGILSTQAGYWLSGKLLPGKNVAVAVSGSGISVVCCL